jgi:hypothetical protein
MALDPNDFPAETENDKILFATLDKESKPLRDSCSELAELLSTLEIRSNEIILLTESLKKVSTSDIKQMDNALNNFKKAFSYLSFRNTDDNIFGPNIPDELYPQLLEKYSVVIREVSALAEKALEMEKSNRG